jgi:hypothetical protein
VSRPAFDLGDRVVVLTSPRTKEAGTAGWHGTVVGKSTEDDERHGTVQAYAVAVDERDELVSMVEPDDLAASQE